MRLEVWRSIPEAPYFTISNHGRVQYTVSGELMEQHIDEDEGCIGVFLQGDTGQPFFVPVDVLVVESFFGPVDGLEEIVHIDGDPWNSNDWNLDVNDSYWTHRMACDDCE